MIEGIWNHQFALLNLAVASIGQDSLSCEDEVQKNTLPKLVSYLHFDFQSTGNKKIQP